MTTQLKTEIRDFIVENFLFGEGGDTLTDGQSLVEAGLIDSLGVAELVAFIESRYGVVPADEELIPDNFDSIERVASYVELKKAA